MAPSSWKWSRSCLGSLSYTPVSSHVLTASPRAGVAFLESKEKVSPHCCSFGSSRSPPNIIQPILRGRAPSSSCPLPNHCPLLCPEWKQHPFLQVPIALCAPERRAHRCLVFYNQSHVLAIFLPSVNELFVACSALIYVVSLFQFVTCTSHPLKTC